MLLQSMAIVEYLDEVQPNPPFLPGHPGDRGAGPCAGPTRRLRHPSDQQPAYPALSA
ncbi:MAG: hypothetical protein WDN69_28495 [Aliidongia sp.]